ncbi:MAG: SPASM domain-containing protein, partial [Vicinamibacteria bacterium]
GYTTWANQSKKVQEYAPTEFAKYIPPDQRTFACRAPWDSVVIFWDGRVGLCCQDYDAKVVIGDTKSESLRSIWNGEAMVEIRRRFTRLDFGNPLCAKCTNYASLTRAHPKNRLYPFDVPLRRLRSGRA